MKKDWVLTEPSPLRVRRISVGLSQRDLAVLVDRSAAWMHRLEYGKRGAYITPEDAARIADVLGVEVSDLFGDKAVGRFRS